MKEQLFKNKTILVMGLGKFWACFGVPFVYHSFVRKGFIGDTIIAIIEQNLETLKKLCRQYHVFRLELIGSAVTGEKFDLKESDIDFLVEFQPLKEGEYADTYFGLLEVLEALFNRHVDLVMVRAIKNPYFLEAINKSRKVLYAA